MALNSGIAPKRKAAFTIPQHWKGILRWLCTRLINGIIEGLNSLVQAAKRKSEASAPTTPFTTSPTSLQGNSTYTCDSPVDTRQTDYA